MIIELIILPFFILILYLFTSSNLTAKDKDLIILYKKGFILKIFGGICFSLLYTFYYKYGDTFVYYKNAVYLNSFVFSDFPFYIKSIFTSGGDYSNFSGNEISNILYLGTFFKGRDTFLTVKITSILSFFTFNSYILTTVLFSYLSFLASWKFYTIFMEKFPSIKKELFWCVFFVPTLLFWTTGILKDTLALILISYLFYFLVRILYDFKFRIKYILGFIICSILLLSLKSYLLYVFIPSFLVGIYFTYLSKINSFFLKLLSGTVLLFVFVFASIFLIKSISQSSGKFKLENAMSTAQTYQKYHGYLDDVGEVGSGYKINGDMSTVRGMLMAAPQAINVSLFRPYIWEVNNPVMFLSSLESLFFIIFTLYVIYKSKLAGLFIYMKKPLTIMSLIFAIIFSFVVGLTAYNFGALVRYKTPMLSFYLIAMLLILKKYPELKKEDKLK